MIQFNSQYEVILNPQNIDEDCNKVSDFEDL